MNVSFCDLDEYISKQENKTISEIFTEGGEKHFRELETKYLFEIADRSDSQVVALGGGTICNEKNLEKVKNSGLLIYIELPASALAGRIKNSRTERPLLKDVKTEQLLHTIESKLEERKKYYTQAHITVNGLNLTPQLLHQLIRESTF